MELPGGVSKGTGVKDSRSNVIFSPRGGSFQLSWQGGCGFGVNRGCCLSAMLLLPV